MSYTKNKTNIKYTFFNSGNSYDFNPDKVLYDIRQPDQKQTALKYHMSLVSLYNDPSTFITDDKGNIIFKSSKPVKHVTANWRKILKGLK